jgi:hypothetical protein
MRDDGSMDRFEANASRFSARDAVVAVLVALALFVLLEEGPLSSSVDEVTKPLSPDRALSARGGFDTPPSGGADAVAPVTAAAFDPAALGLLTAKQPLRRLLVTGDSLSTPLDLELARRLTGAGVKVERDPHLGSGISKTSVIDWGRLAVTQIEEHEPDAVVVFIGANEGFPMEGADGEDVECCSPEWAAIYANRTRQMIATYRRGGATRVYWVTVPAPRDPDRQEIERVVNAAIAVAVEPWRADVRLVDTVAQFTPGDRYRDEIDVGGRSTLVREADGIHLNRRGAALLADRIEAQLKRDFTVAGG